MKRSITIARLSNQKGYLALLAILIILVIGFLGSTISSIFTNSATASLNAYLSEKAYFIAQAGVEQATRYVLQNGIACASVTGHADLSNASFGGGQFTVTGVPTVATTSTTGAITNADTSIALTSAASFAASGIITIDNEVMSYAGVSGNTLTGVSRGIFTTTAVGHASGATVSQNQCTLDSIAGISSLSSPIAQNEIVKIIPLFNTIGGFGGWTVGDVVGGNYTAAKWTGSAWIPVSFPSSGSPVGAYGLSVINANNLWLSGDQGNFYSWNGATWTLSKVTPAGATYYQVSCGSDSDCHSVSDYSGNTPGLVNWTPGSGWQWIKSTSGVQRRSNLRAVHCSSASNCWAMGENTNGSTFYQWTGSGWVGYNNTLTAYPYNGVFCNSASDCWAVGANATFARYNGTTWSNYATGLPSAQYNGIICNTSSDCWAVGNANGGRDLIVRWNGSSWSRDPSNPTPLANLKGISCASPTNCWAVGVSSVGGSPIFVQYDGASWANVTVAGMPTVGSLNAIAFGGGVGVSIPTNSAVVIQKIA